MNIKFRVFITIAKINRTQKFPVLQYCVQQILRPNLFPYIGV